MSSTMLISQMWEVFKQIKSDKSSLILLPPSPLSFLRDRPFGVIPTIIDQLSLAVIIQYIDIDRSINKLVKIREFQRLPIMQQSICLISGSFSDVDISHFIVSYVTLRIDNDRY